MLVPVSDVMSVCFPGAVAVLPGVPGYAPAPTAPGCAQRLVLAWRGHMRAPSR